MNLSIKCFFNGFSTWAFHCNLIFPTGVQQDSVWNLCEILTLAGIQAEISAGKLNGAQKFQL